MNFLACCHHPRYQISDDFSCCTVCERIFTGSCCQYSCECCYVFLANYVIRVVVIENCCRLTQVGAE